MHKLSFAVFLLLVTSTGCKPEADTRAPAPYHPLERATDLDPDDSVLEVDLVAQGGEVEIVDGVPSRNALTYNGMFPGPLLEAKLGDTVKVHFRNDLGTTTTVHWHGLRVPAAMDGTMLMMNPVPAAGGTFEFEFTLRDSGLYWYHPHMNTDNALERGLYAPILVRDPTEPKELTDLPEDILVLDDISVSGSGMIDTPSGMDSIDGLEGQTMLVNGRPDAVLPLRAGEIRRWRILNAASARYFDLYIPGHTFHVIGTDGGRVETPYDVDEILLTPGERVDVLVRGVLEPGAESGLFAKSYNRGQMHGVDGRQKVAVVRYSDASPLDDKAFPSTSLPIVPILDLGTAPIRDIVIDETEGGFAINGELWPQITPIHVDENSVEIWRIANESDWDHPFHLHGNFFQPLTVDGEPRDLVWKDTINVKRHTVTEVAVRHDNPGHWMFHCHILGHAEDLGMAGELHVGD